MRKNVKILCFMLCICILMPLAACTNEGKKAVFAYDGHEMSASFASFSLASYKGIIASMFYQYYTTDITADNTFWDTIDNSDDVGRTYAQTFNESFVEACKMYVIVEKLCKDFGITLEGDTEINDSIEKSIQTSIDDLGGEDNLVLELATYGVSMDDYRAYLSNSHKRDKLYEFLYGQSGTRKLPESELREYFDKNYLSYEAIIVPFSDSATSSSVLYEFEDEEMEEYFYKNFVKASQVLYMTVDTSYAPLSEAQIAVAKEDAEKALKDIQDGTRSFEEVQEDENQSSSTPAVFTYGQMVTAYEEAAFDMEPGEIRLVESEYGYHILKKHEITEDDYTDTNKSKTQAAMSKKVIVDFSEELIKKLQNDPSLFVEYKADENNPYDVAYTIYEDVVYDRNNLNTSLVELLDANEHDKFFSDYETGYPEFRIIVKREPDDDDFAAALNTIDEYLSEEAFYNYLKSMLDSVSIDSEEIAKFDIKTHSVFDTTGQFS